MPAISSDLPSKDLSPVRGGRSFQTVHTGRGTFVANACTRIIVKSKLDVEVCEACLGCSTRRTSLDGECWEE
jgi:hypothetical protein